MTVAELRDRALTGDDAALDALRRLTLSDDPVTASQAVAALSQVGTREAIAAGLLRLSGVSAQAALDTSPGTLEKLRQGAILVAVVAFLAIAALIQRRGR